MNVGVNVTLRNVTVNLQEDLSTCIFISPTMAVYVDMESEVTKLVRFQGVVGEKHCRLFSYGFRLRY